MTLFRKAYSREEIILEGYIGRMKGFVKLLKDYPNSLPRVWGRYMNVKSQFMNFKKTNTNTSRQIQSLIYDCEEIINNLDQRTEKLMGKVEKNVNKNFTHFNTQVGGYLKSNDNEAEEMLRQLMMRDALVRGDNETYERYANQKDGKSR